MATALIPEYLRAARAGDVLDASGRRYSDAALRSLRRTLAHVEANLDDADLASVDHADGAALEALARRVVDRGGLPPNRLETILDALRRVSAPAGPQFQAEPQARVQPAPDPVTSPAARTPTFAMLALGAHISVWVERIIVIAFVLTAIGLALELA
jgi:hypothetical protein